MSNIANLLQFLDSERISYTRYDHQAVFTCEQSAGLNLNFPGAETKNLFLAEKGGGRRFLVTVPHEKRVNLKGLASLVGVKRFDFGSSEDLHALLGVTPGSVTLLGLMVDVAARVEVVIDQPIWDADAVLCHPMTNTSTLRILKADLERFLQCTRHTPRVMLVPG